MRTAAMFADPTRWPAGSPLLEPWDWNARVSERVSRASLGEVIADIEAGVWSMGHDPGMAIVTSDAIYVDELDGTRWRILRGFLAGRA